MSENSFENQGFLSRVRVIEGQPLNARAEAYNSLHEELSRSLDSGAPRPSAEPLA